MIKAVVVCEDHTLDEYILKPIIEMVFREHSQQVRIQVHNNPQVRGVTQALSRQLHSKVLALYPMAGAFFLIVDRDCKPNRHKGNFRMRLQEAKVSGRTMFGCITIEEVEVWALALHRRELGIDWKAIRGECHPKEAHFEPFSKRKGWHTGPGRGRKSAMQNLGKNEWEALKSLCPELRTLSEEVKQWLIAPK